VDAEVKKRASEKKRAIKKARDEAKARIKEKLAREREEARKLARMQGKMGKDVRALVRKEGSNSNDTISNQNKGPATGSPSYKEYFFKAIAIMVAVAAVYTICEYLNQKSKDKRRKSKRKQRGNRKISLLATQIPHLKSMPASV